MSIPEILDGAASVIETRGWHQGEYVPVNSDPFTGPCCTSAAINVAAGLMPNGYAPGRLPAAQAREARFARFAFAKFLGHEVISWNDDVATSAEQVTKALRECAAELSKETTR